MYRNVLAAGLVAIVAPALAQTTNYDVIPLGMSITGPDQLTFGAWFFDYEKGKVLCGHPHTRRSERHLP